MSDLTWIYVITNPSFPKYVKVGWTRHNPHKRIGDIDTTGVPTPFDLNYVACVDDARKLEKLTHQFLDRHRVRSSREFFEVSAMCAREAIRSVAISSGIVLHFDKTYIEADPAISGNQITNFDTQADDDSDSLAESLFEQLGAIDFSAVNVERGENAGSAFVNAHNEDDTFDELYSCYASLVVKALLDFDVAKGMRALIDLSRWLEHVPSVCDVFANEELAAYQVGFFERVEADHNFAIYFAIPDNFIDDFLELAVDENCVRFVVDWLELVMATEAQGLRVARYYISQGKTPRIKLLAANYLYEICDDCEEVLNVYASELKVDRALIREPSYYLSINQIVNQSFVRMCDIVIRSNCHDYDDFLRRFLGFLESSQSSFERGYPGLRTVMHCYFDGGDFNGCFPLSSYYAWIAGFYMSYKA